MSGEILTWCRWVGIFLGQYLCSAQQPWCQSAAPQTWAPEAAFPIKTRTCSITALHQNNNASMITGAQTTYHDGSEPTSAGFSLQSHPGYGPQGIWSHVEFTLRQKQSSVHLNSEHPVVQGNKTFFIGQFCSCGSSTRKACCHLGASETINYVCVLFWRYTVIDKECALAGIRLDDAALLQQLSLSPPPRWAVVSLKRMRGGGGVASACLTQA